MLKSIEQERDYYKKEHEKLKRKNHKLESERHSQHHTSPTRSSKEKEKEGASVKNGAQYTAKVTN